MNHPQIQPIILSGGSGTRLWPLSREKYPKQLLPLIGDESLLQATVRRVRGAESLALLTPIVVCTEEYRFVVAEQLRQIDQEGALILEPVGRNTAPALTLAALAARAGGCDPVLWVMPADHLITDTQAFQAALRAAAVLAGDGAVLTFGMTPDTAETGYGYIQSISEGVPSRGAAQRIARFVEKPDLVTAQAYMAEGNYLWNSGIFVLRASVWLDALGQCCPDILQACQAAWKAKSNDGDFVRVDTAAFRACPSDSIDYAVMEHLSTGGSHANTPKAYPLPLGLVIPLAAGWSDVGALEALWNVTPKDEDGNVTKSDVMMHESRNTLALSEGRSLTCVGVQDLVVVETADAVPVAHRKVHRPWGCYDGVDHGTRLQVKRITAKPGAALSLQMHHHRAEHWIVVSGTARVTKGEDVYGRSKA